ncbi:hypothetical protein MGYG_07216 [Nannizzia gypsea CBS 118893]|uniref:MIF domain-containing protein n=1 Tax=Arthroderma gypseum (strain ATCC MYA-4604 / CBS 118893) TaxID=535722 RepID=E4V2E4_ARTGP|nr:hypothetical protein MGYG_07216 [Nannizzia gypsea CBS 118893]EFR04209.1 hypothetical protein MGYG_07216 [Nannizzia gypsea CBS 118893]
MDGDEEYSSNARAKTPETKSPRRSIAISSIASTRPSKNDIVARDLGCGGFMSSGSCNPNLADILEAERDMIATERLRGKQHFNDGFSYTSFRERVKHDSVIIVEIRTNKRVDDPYEIISKLISEFKTLFDNHPITVSIDDEVKISMSEFTDEPAYIVTVTALAAMLTPLCNFRFTTNIQEEIRKVMDISPDHGLVRLSPMPEDFLGIGGTTYGQKIKDLENASTGITRDISRKASTSKKSSSAARFVKKIASKFNFNSPSSWQTDKQAEMTIDMGSNRSQSER